MEFLPAYMPTDRRIALATGQSLPEHTSGAALFADISGFTKLTETLVRALGPQRGAEELPRQINLVYDAVIAETDRYGGSVLGFAGDAITCWFANQTTDASGQGDAPFRTAACALAIQRVMEQFAAISIPGIGPVSLAIKVAITVGPAHRFIIGDARIQLIDALAGETIARLAVAEHLAERGDVIIDTACVAALGDAAVIRGWRDDAETGQRFALLDQLTTEVAPTPWPLLETTLSDAMARPWLLPPVYERLQGGMGEFLTELRPAVALFLRFGGIDYDTDAEAGSKLNRYIVRAEQVLQRYGAHLLQLTIGDKGCYFYSAFGAPVAYEDNASRAASAALELVALPPELAYISAVQIGLSQGRMRTGAYGGTTRRTYGVLGDDVNLAARLMQAAPPGQIYVSLSARKATADHFVWWKLPPLLVKGKAEPIAIQRLLEAQDRQTIRLQAPRYAIPLIGRSAELALINQRQAQAVNGFGQIVGLSAEAGLGKSRLVAEVVRAAQTNKLVAFGGECHAYGTNTSYLVWQPIWRAFFGLAQGQTLDAQIETIARELSRIDPALLPRLPLLGAVLNLHIPDNELTSGFDAKLRKASLEALLVTCLLARAEATPLLLVLEDSHWIDPLSHDLLETIGRAIATAAVLLLVVYRPPQVERTLALRVTRLTHFSEIALTTLAPPEIEQLLRSKLANLYGPAVEVLPILVEQVSTRAQGNPFYVEELLNYLHDCGIDPQDPTAIAALDVPVSLQNLILSRIDQLSENQKTLLKIASVIGRLFHTGMLWGVYRSFGATDRLHEDLEHLSHAELTAIDTPDPELMYLFKHVVTQEVAYASLPYATRAVLHNHIGLYIEQARAQVLDRFIDLLAYHFDLSANLPKKRTYLLKAGDHAQADYANLAAISYFQRALPLLADAERGTVLLKIGQVLELTGQWPEAEGQYQQALALAEQLGDLLAQEQSQLALGELRRRQGHYAEAAERYTTAQALAEQLGDQAGLAKALICAGTLATQQGDFATARAHYGRSLDIRRALDDQFNIANILNNLSIIAYSEGDYPQARALQAESLTIRRTLGHKWALANSLNNLGTILIEQGELAQARVQLEEALNLQRELGDPAALALTLHSIADLERTSGAYATALTFYAESLTINVRVGDRWTAIQALEDVAWLAALQGEPERALRLAGAAAATRAAMGTPLPPGDQTRLDAALAPARQALAERAAPLWAEGQALSFEQAVALALATA